LRAIEDEQDGVEELDDPAALVEPLKKEGGGDIWHMGGGKSIEPFERLGLIDRWELTIVPIRLGAGIPLFRSDAGLLVGCRLTRVGALPMGMVELHYQPKNAAGGNAGANGGR